MTRAGAIDGAGSGPGPGRSDRHRGTRGTRGTLPLLATAFSTFLHNGLQWYTQVSTYPLFGAVAPDSFVPYHRAYERHLPLSIYAPWAAAAGSALLLLFRRPAGVSLAPVVALNLLHGAIPAISVGLAAPVHARLDREGRTPQGVRRLLALNGARLVLATVASAIVLRLLARLLAVSAPDGVTGSMG